MYKVLVVEDIVHIRRGIVSIIDEKYNFETVEVCNGKEALEKIEQEKIDFILTDIRMPICGGIELIKIIREENKDIPIIIISGYGEFEYAEKAINMGVNGYILKPIEDRKFEKVINKVIKVLEKKNKNKSLEDSYIGLKDTIIAQDKEHRLIKYLLNNEKITNESIVKELENKQFSVAVINIDMEYGNIKSFDYDDVELIKYAIRCLIKELDIGKLIYILDSTVNINQIIIVFADADGENINSYRSCKNIADKIEELLKFKVSIGVSNISGELDSNIYKEAEDSLQMRFFRRDRKIFRNNINENSDIYISLLGKISLLEKYMQRGDLKNIRLILDGLFNISNTEINPRKYIQYIINEIIEIVIKLYGYEVYSQIESSFKLDSINEFNNLEQLMGNIINTLEKVYEIKKIKVIDNINIVEKVKVYIDKNYAEDITVKDLSRRFSVNYSYLSSSFTKDIGISIVAYITEIRIGHARRLLDDSKGDIATISEAVGYSDVQYFYRVFKKSTGKTPLAYRNTTKKVQ